MNDFIIVGCGVVSCSVILLLIGAVYWWRYRGVATAPDLERAGAGPGKPLGPLRRLTKNVSPWNIISISNDKNVSIDSQGRIKISFVRGQWGMSSGGAFHANPFKSLPASSCVVSYALFVPQGFNFNKGGKLPGVCFGDSLKSCASGGDWSNTSGSARVWFNGSGRISAYVYMPFGDPKTAYNKQTAAVRRVMKLTGRTGIYILEKSPLQLRVGSWNALSMTVTLNAPGQSNGSLGISVNGVSRQLDGIRWRDTASIRISSLNIVSFFGGGSRDWAAPAGSPYVLIDDVRFSAA